MNEIAISITLTGEQAQALVDILNNWMDGDDIQLTSQRDGDLVVGTQVVTFNVEPNGEYEPI